MIFYENDPFGEWRNDYRASLAPTMLANALGQTDKYRVEHFMLQTWPEAQKPGRTLEEWRMLLSTLNAAFGGKDLRNADGR